MKAHRAVAHVLVVTDGNAFGPVLAQVFPARISPGGIVDPGEFATRYHRLAIGARVFCRWTNTFVEINMRYAGGAVAAVVVGAHVVRPRVSVAIGPAVPRPT